MRIKLSSGYQTDIHVEVYGQGTPLLFLHGGPGCCHDSFAPFFKPLAEQCQIIYFDQLACGKSSWKIQGEYHIAHELEVIEHIRQHLGHEKLTVIGESWGTMLALQYASHYPERISDLILLSSVGYGIEQMQLFGENLMSRVSDEDKQQIALIDQQQQRAEIDKLTALNRSQDILNPYYLYNRANLAKVINQLINFEQYLRVVAKFEDELDYLSRLEQIQRVRIHMYQASHDLINDLDIQSILVNKLNPVSFTTVPECGHWIYLEQTDYINSEILRIVSKPDEESIPPGSK